MKKRKIRAVIALLAALALMVGACGKAEETTSDSSVASETVEVQEEGGLTEYTDVSLLTGLPMDDELIGKRPVAMMIENTKAALPHYDINRAGIIYECPVEGGLTRYMALLDDYRDIEKIGNLRSSRPYYVYLASEYQAIYMHIGGSVHALDLLESGIVNNLNGLNGNMNDTYYLSSDRKRPHNTYTGTEGILKGIETMGYADEYDGTYPGHFQFASEENTLDEGEDVAVIQEYFFDNKPYFIYDEDEKVYKRYEYGKEEVDAVDGEQMSFTNIIFMNISSSLYDGGQYLNIPLNGSGEGKFFTNGKMVDITWEKDSDTDITNYYMPNGEEIKLNPGKTWISLIEYNHADKNGFYKSVEEFKNK